MRLLQLLRRATQHRSSANRKSLPKGFHKIFLGPKGFRIEKKVEKHWPNISNFNVSKFNVAKFIVKKVLRFKFGGFKVFDILKSDVLKSSTFPSLIFQTLLFRRLTFKILTFKNLKICCFKVQHLKVRHLCHPCSPCRWRPEVTAAGAVVSIFVLLGLVDDAVEDFVRFSVQ
jgi:hypothetical protein